jgi:hypothetical protein
MEPYPKASSCKRLLSGNVGRPFWPPPSAAKIAALQFLDGLNVLVHSKEIIRIVFILDSDQPLARDFTLTNFRSRIDA